MKKNKQLSDQTKFIQENPLYEKEEQRWWQEGKSRIKTDIEFLQSPKGKIVVIAGSILLITAVGLIILAFLRKRPQKQPGNQIVVPEQESEELSQLQERIIDLRKQLQDSDPAKRETPFPQVDMSIRVIDPQD